MGFQRKSDKDNKSSVEKKRANKEHTCIYCGGRIRKGQEYISKPEHPKRLVELLEERTGYTIREIKGRTKFWYVDNLAWKFCSLECLRRWAAVQVEELPEDVRNRMEELMKAIVERVGDALEMMVKLGGRNDRERV